ncbi:uncharacterized protein LAJ45_08249 [Morchella importuna]|uniref:uncharacterized protein n=1 Tax=Morchella importuna TaxID=1174673 RepID=UPI001E8DD49E|nr:uncharacterized protein LAJ45_08249 [Morchella importuna]KAH8147783.1 hypothetical protein LAJ45_08249 [Morchella importuna]
METPHAPPDTMKINDLLKDDEIVFRGRCASRIPIIIVTDYSFLRGEFDKMSDDPINDDNESDVSMDEQSKEKDSCCSSPTSIYSLLASSDGGVPVSSSTVRSDSLSASYRHLVSPSKASTIEGTRSSRYSGGGDGGTASSGSNCPQQGGEGSKDRKSKDGNVHDRVLLLIVEDYFGTPASATDVLKERIQMWMVDVAAGPHALPHYDPEILEPCSK